MNDPPNPARVLIVEDDPLDREVYKRYLLNTPGRTFVFAEEATAARAIARIPEFQPHCILLDFSLPDMNGLEMLDRLANGSPSLPAAVVMLTAAKDERIAIAAMKSGAMDYLPKGQFAADTIAYAVDSAINKFQLEREIEEQQRRYRSLIEAIPQIVWTANPDGKLEFANARWFESLGIDTERFNESGWAILVHPDDRDRSLETWTYGLRSGTAFQVEHRLRRLPGDAYRWYLSRAVPVCDAHGAVTNWFGTSTDIEDQKRNQLAVFARQKLESLGLLAGGIAHDFNNLLVGILGGASLIADSLPESHPQQSILAGIIDAGERAAHLTRQMLAYAGKGRFLIQQIDINEQARSTCDLIRASIPKNVTVMLRLDPDVPLVDADSSQVQQVIMNLVLNSAEAVDENTHGTVIVRTERAHIVDCSARTEPTTGSLAPGGYVVLHVEDDGSGMDEATRRRIFDPFFTTKFTGRGLGLSAVEGIVRGHNAALEVESALGVGSKFRVYFPESASAARSRGESDPGAQAKGVGTVLVVDDEEIVRRTARLSLENSGFRVRLAETGEEAIRTLQSRGNEPVSLVLLDLSMPGMNGRQTLQHMRLSGIRVPVLICSGYSEAEIGQEFAGLDIAGIVEKPFTTRQLAERVTKVLRPGQ